MSSKKSNILIHVGHMTNMGSADKLDLCSCIRCPHALVGVSPTSKNTVPMISNIMDKFFDHYAFTSDMLTHCSG